MEKIFKIIVKKNIKTKDGRTFNGYKAVQKDGTIIECRFRKELNPPDETCLCRVDSGDEPIRTAMNIDYTHEYPRLWIAVQPEYLPLNRGSDNDDIEEF